MESDFRFLFSSGKFQGEYGEYRSPLKFYNGDSVRSAGDWAKRKEEIKTRWHELMGEWPELITGQKFEIIESEERELHSA